MMWLILVVIFVLPAYSNAQDSLGVCARSNFLEECAQINRTDRIKCHMYKHNLDCLMSISNGTTSFGMVTPDEAAIASGFLNDITVVAEIRPYDAQTESEEFQMVVVVKEKVNSFNELGRKGYCHPGYGKMNIPNYMVDMFENAVLEATSGKGCNSEGTLIEYRIKKLNEFFGLSCKPGPWVYDDAKDKELKRTYTKLCATCDGYAGDRCTLETARQPFEAAMKCFENGGHVAVTTLKEARKSSAPRYYLTPSGNSTTEPHVWSRRPWPIIVANTKSADNVVGYLKETFYDQMVQSADVSAQRKLDLKPYLQNLFKSDSTKRYKIMKVDLQSYLNDFKYIPEDPSCDAKLTWCVTSDAELQKCKWFARATKNQGILPGIACLQKPARVECLKAIGNGDANIVAIDNNLGYTARKYKLRAIAFPETSEEVRSMMVVKNVGNNIQLSNLKGKKGCFAEFGDISYISFFQTLNDSGLVTPTCDYGKFSNQFLDESCVPGINDPYRLATKVTDVNKLCSICNSEKSAATCKASYENEYFGNEGALRCLGDIGDFAVISNRNLSESILSDEKLTVVCNNGSLASYSGLKVDDLCYLSITSSSELVVKQDFKYFNDSLITLAAFEVIFGQDLHKPFDLFGPFNGTFDLLFKESTPGLNFNPSENRYTQNYIDIFAGFDNCIKDGRADAVKINNMFVTTTVLIVLGMVVNYV